MSSLEVFCLSPTVKKKRNCSNRILQAEFKKEAREINTVGSSVVMELNISYFQPSNQKDKNVEHTYKNYMVT